MNLPPTAPNGLSPHTPPYSPPPSPPVVRHQVDNPATVKPSSPQTMPISEDNSDSPQKQKVSLALYRARAKPVDNAVPHATAGSSFEAKPVLSDHSATNSPFDSSAVLRNQLPTASGDNTASPFNISTDSPRNMLKLKRDPATGESHAVKYTPSGLKIKIKTPKMEGTPNSIPEEGGGPNSKSATPCEEGEITESPTGRKSDSIRIRIPVPKSESNNGMSNSELSSDHQHGYHHSHHGHEHGHKHKHKKNKKEKKHKEHRRDKHEKHERSSKRSSSTALDGHEDRPSKALRIDPMSSGGYSNRHHGNSSATATAQGSYADPPGAPPSTTSSRQLQHQNSGFSIDNAFTSTMPNNIFDDSDEEDLSSGFPPITPTAENPHHQHSHQLMAQYRANQAKRPPLPPMPTTRGPPPPPPPPPSDAPGGPLRF